MIDETRRTVQEALSRIVREHGPVLANDVQLPENLPGEQCSVGSGNREVLRMAAECGVAAQIAAINRTEYLLRRDALVLSIVEEYGIRVEVARWAVDAWADALLLPALAGAESMSTIVEADADTEVVPVIVEDAPPAPENRARLQSPVLARPVRLVVLLLLLLAAATGGVLRSCPQSPGLRGTDTAPAAVAPAGFKFEPTQTLQHERVPAKVEWRLSSQRVYSGGVVTVSARLLERFRRVPVKGVNLSLQRSYDAKHWASLGSRRTTSSWVTWRTPRITKKTWFRIVFASATSGTSEYLATRSTALAVAIRTRMVAAPRAVRRPSRRSQGPADLRLGQDPGAAQ